MRNFCVIFVKKMMIIARGQPGFAEKSRVGRMQG